MQHRFLGITATQTKRSVINDKLLHPIKNLDNKWHIFLA